MIPSSIQFMARIRETNDSANAELIGVVLLIAILTVTAGLLTVNVFSTPMPEKVPAASLRLETDSDMKTISILHEGGDSLPFDLLTLRVKYKDAGSTTQETMIAGSDLYDLDTHALVTDNAQLSNGNGAFFDLPAISGFNTFLGAVLIWSDRSGGAAAIASLDPSGSFGRLVPGTLPAGMTIDSTPAYRTQPTVPRPETNWSPSQNVTANFSHQNAPQWSSLITTQPYIPVHFTDLSTGPVTSWYWYFGDGGTSSDASPEHTYNTSGVYTVSLTVRNASGTGDTMVRDGYVTVSETISPVVIGAYVNNVETDHGNTPLTVTLVDESLFNRTMWEWDFGDGNSTGKLLHGQEGWRQNHTFYNDGLHPSTYTVTLKVWSPYLNAPVVGTREITVNPPLIADFDANVTAGVVPLTVQFNDRSSNLPEHWQWTFGDGSSSDEQNPVHVYNNIGTYTVSLEIYDSGWGASAYKTKTDYILVVPPVSTNFTADEIEGVPPLTVHFTDTSTGDPTEWLWSFGDGTDSLVKNPDHTYSSDGNYTVTLLARNAYPNSADLEVKIAYIHVGPPVVADFTANRTAGLTPMAVAFQDNSSGGTIVSWLWDFGDGTNSTAQNPIHVYEVPGTYTVSLTAANLYRNDAISRVGYITVMAPIDPLFDGSPRVVPVGGSVIFTDRSTGGPTSWLWTFGDGGTSTAQNPTHVYSAAGTYPVSLTASHALDSKTLTQTGYITVIESVTAAFNTSPTEGTAPFDVTFTDLSAGHPDAWSWEFGDEGTSSIQSPTHQYTVPGNYTVNLTAWNSLRPDLTSKASATVAVYGVPEASFTAVDGTSLFWVTFTDTSTGNPTAWLWDFGDDQTSDARNPEYHFTTAGDHTVRLTVSNPAGSDSVEQLVTVLAPTTEPPTPEPTPEPPTPEPTPELP